MTEPHASGLLEVGEGSRIYWESCGNADGKPMVVLHGGPGRGGDERMRAGEDPHGRYRVALLDQRGCGRSTPHAADPATSMAHNTTAHLVADLELLREHLGIDRWLLRGGSWGVTLALVYASSYPHRVSEIVLSSVFIARPGEIDRLYGGVGWFFPEEYRRFTARVRGTDEELRVAPSGRDLRVVGIEPRHLPCSRIRPPTLSANVIRIVGFAVLTRRDRC
ncbi:MULTISPECIES: alpha/beta fold hydrolase [Nocardia]|uniref:alpha/beta fold hydrolase n=1 Tax=Nocardia TaxID=1817 RepID=UPI001E597EF6|nr:MULTISPECIES: alpha/beta fold hydrolase [Nocardia]